MDELSLIRAIILRYQEDHLFPPKKNWPDLEKHKRCIERAAVSLILEEIESSKGSDVKHILFLFHEKMDSLYEENYDRPFADIFIIGRELAKELYLLFC